MRPFGVQPKWNGPVSNISRHTMVRITERQLLRELIPIPLAPWKVGHDVGEAPAEAQNGRLAATPRQRSIGKVGRRPLEVHQVGLLDAPTKRRALW